MNGQHKRRSTAGGIALGFVASLVFLAAASACAFIILGLRARVHEAESEVRYNAAWIEAWDGEIDARKADIKDLQHFFPSHGQPAANPPSSNPTVPPSPHN
jgi:hypothetical protein